MSPFEVNKMKRTSIQQIVVDKQKADIFLKFDKWLKTRGKNTWMLVATNNIIGRSNQTLNVNDIKTEQNTIKILECTCTTRWTMGTPPSYKENNTHLNKYSYAIRSRRKDKQKKLLGRHSSKLESTYKTEEW